LARTILRKTTLETPKDATHWSTRSLAKALGCDHTLVHRVWRLYGLKPHLVNTFKVSNDPRFAEKVIDVVGLYLDPPDHALVLCVDEKSQIQALDRTQKSLPLFPGRLGTLTHDYHAVCRLGAFGRQTDRNLHEASPAAGMGEVPEAD
jgi:hypothetical protein